MVDDPVHSEGGHLRALCRACGEIKMPDFYSTAGAICTVCRRKASRIEHVYTIEGIVFRVILHPKPSAAAALKELKKGAAS